jgi:predicted Zn-dependent protease
MKQYKLRLLFIVIAMFLSLSSISAYAFDVSGFADAIKGLAGKAGAGGFGQAGLSPNSPSSAESSPGGLNPGGFGLGEISQEEEIKIGKEIAGNLLGAAPLVKDDGLQQYVNRVGRWVASQSERPDLPWHFGVIESEDINAFATPGGFVLITKGLYRKLKNEAQLAGVLGHEISHVVKKHHLEILKKSQLISWGTGLVKDNMKGAGGGLVKNLIGNGAEICARGLDKDSEYEADRMGVILTARAGYDPYGLPDVLQEIGHVAKDDSSVALLFKTHPAPDDRLLKLGDAMGNRLDAVTGGKTLEERFYKLRN